MIMGNGFQEGKTLLFDHLHQQSVRSDGLKTYSETVINTHEDFTRQIMGSSAAKVEIVYGCHVQKRILKIMKCSLLPLWDHFKEYSLPWYMNAISTMQTKNFVSGE